jgi:PDZ domain-containing protein
MRAQDPWSSGSRMSTTMVAVPSPDGPSPAGPRRSRWRSPGAWVAGLVVLVLVAVVASTFVHLPYYLESPGSAPPVGPLIAVDAAHRHPVAGDVLLATVSLQSSVTPIDIVAAWLDPNVNIVKRRDLTGGISTAQFDQQAQVDMSQSERDAIVVALRRLRYPVVEHGSGALIAEVVGGSPAANHLVAGDVVVAAGGKAVSVVNDLTADIRALRPGDPLTLAVERPNKGRLNETVTLTTCPPAQPGCVGVPATRPFLGVSLVTHNETFDFPFKVSIDLTGVGGPSAGLAFTLGVLDTLTTGRITGAHKVAVTGTIDTDGNVGPIGGIALKTVAVERAGADVFLVPKDDPHAELQYSAAAAKARGHHIRVIAVGNLEDALNALRALGGDLSGIGPAPVSPTA